MYVYVDGLERSGNVFLCYVLNLNINMRIFSERKHEIDILQRYKGDAPFIVPLRDALPSLVSARLYRKHVYDAKLFGSKSDEDSQPERLLERYNQYIDYLIDHPEFFIAPFEEFTKHSERFTNTVLKTYSDFERIGNVPIEEILEKAREDQSWNHNQENKFLSNFPRDSFEEKQEATDLFLGGYKEDIDKLQAKIDILYKRYYDLI